MAEHGLWSIWFRSGHPKASDPFRRGIALLSSEAYPEAIDQFHQAVELDAGSSEAYNQREIAHSLLSQWDASRQQCLQTDGLVPAYFGAISGLGHCHAQLGDISQALTCYRRALRINPRM